ncbi:hypothetical protein P9G49_04080 [Heyndrickxia coagulans]|uniref:hypothetical protein n=1 Tax=Heyndrickxia coagulans TaxID=1398 RepID=UPI002E08B4D7|nr:hypothetical protein [Heyndrickxia coagulans]
MTLLGSVDIPFTKSTKIAVDATDTAGQAATVAQQATDTAGQAQATAQTASQTATQAAATAAGAAQAAQTAITTANGKNKAYYGATTPISPQPGDIWFVEDDSNNVTAIKHYDGTQWVTDVNNTELAQQISAAQAAADNAATVGQAAQQTAADAEAKGDAAAQAAEEAKDAATKAQADAASAVTSANNAVSTANQATQVAQDAIDKAQDGFDAAQDALSKAGAAETNSQSALNTASTAAKDAQSALTAAGAAVDTANTAKQVASDAATQASAAKTNAQTAMSNAQDAINQAKAANDNANTREKSIIKSNTAPSNPTTDQLWVDTSKTPQIMRRWNGTAWVDLSPTQAGQIGAVSTTTYTTDITNINNTLSQKASVTTVNTLTGRVDKAETAITQNANAIASKAEKTVVDTLKNTVDNHSTLISQNADAIQLKADKSTVDSLTGRVSTAEATLTAQADQIAARITKTDADAKYATQTALTATANSLTSSITAVQTNLDNLQVGGTNLVGKFNAKRPLSTITSNSKSGFGIHLNGTEGPQQFGQLNLKQNQYYTISFTAWWTGENGTGKMYCDLYPDTLPESPDWTVTTTPTRYYWTTASSESDITNCQLRFWKLDSGDIYITDIKLEMGNKPTDWSHAPEDLATKSQISQLSDDINLRVQKGDVINQINVSTEGILIDGKKVHITGQTTIDNAVIKDAMIQSMTANKLTAGTIDANVITVKNINASNIVTGTLDASKATVTNIDASKITTGTLNAARIAAGSIDASKLNVSTLSAISANLGNVTAGNISGVNIYGGSITQSSNGQNIWIDQNGYHMQAGQLDIWMNNGRGLEVLYNNESKFRIDPNGNLTANDGTFIGNIRSADDNYKMGTEIYSGGLYTAYSADEGSSFTSEFDSGYISLKEYPTKIPFNKSNIWESIQKGEENFKTRYSARGMECWSLNTPGNYLDSEHFYIERGKDRGVIYSTDNMEVSVDFGDLSLKGGNIYLTPLKKVYLGGTLNIGNNIDLSWNSSNNSLEFSKGIKSGNILINGYHAIKSLDGGQIYLNDGGTGYVDLTVKTLHQASRWELKENFEVMDPEVALKNIINTDVVRYNFKGESEIHVGLVIDDRDNPEYHACSDFITPDRQAKKDETIVGELMLATKALNTYINGHKERLSIIEEQNKNLILKVANLEMELANIKQKLGVA